MSQSLLKTSQGKKDDTPTKSATSVAPQQHHGGIFADMDETAFWTPDEFEKLLTIWADKADAIASSRNEVVMQDISEALGGSKTSKQVRAKLKKLRCKYLLEKHKVERGCKPRWRHYDRLSLISNIAPRAPANKKSGIVAEEKTDTEETTEKMDTSPATPALLISSSTVERKARDPIVRTQVSPDWLNWNSQQLYPLTIMGLKQLIHHGFTCHTHLDLLKGRKLEPLGLNYHDMLALERTLESTDNHFQVVSSGDGGIIEVKYVKSLSDKSLLPEDGVSDEKE